MTEFRLTAISCSVARQAGAGRVLAVLSAAVDRATGSDHRLLRRGSPTTTRGAFKGSGRGFAEMICASTDSGPLTAMHHLLGSRCSTSGATKPGARLLRDARGSAAGRMASFGRYIDYSFASTTGGSSIPASGADATFPVTTRSTGRPLVTLDHRYDRLTSPPK